ncbi:ribosomal RNA processing protein 1 homolog [Thrips palmi]|uniref:Ribosomal RNA processing protein 1 homolog n=1 Tax=Thrips palmi TaxID=161013 RepID=A0A6P8ZRW4_THRPL|nr:ribosomal RNA processing protein 1 homolog [Thrips palmi]
MVVMKASEDTKPRGKNASKNQDKALLVAQEISFAKILAGNDKKLRDRGVKRLKKWLNARSNSESALEKDDFMRLWKGLYYCMWMADKPLIQEELAETISSLVHSFDLTAPAILFIETFFRTMCIEWPGIDQHRLEKFLMFVRRFLRQSLVLVEHQNWNSQLTDSLCEVFESTLLPDHANLPKSGAPLGLVMHFVEIFLEELAKVSKGKLNEAVLLRVLRVFAQHIAAVRDARMRSHITRHIFIRLIEQSPVGLEFQDKFRAWQKLGFPGGSIDVMERADDEANEESDEGSLENDHDNSEGPLDPRAGAVHVELPLISFDAASIAKLLGEFRFKKYTNAKTRKHIADLINKFEDLASGNCPIGMKKAPHAPKINFKQLAQKAAEKLLNYESELLDKEDSDNEHLSGSDVEDQLEEEGSDNEHAFGSDVEDQLEKEDSDDEHLFGSDVEHQCEEEENNGGSEDDTLRENEKIAKKLKRQGKRKTSAPEKKISIKRKAPSNDQSEGTSSDNIVSKVTKKVQGDKTKLKNKVSPVNSVFKTASGSGVDAEVERVDMVQISNGADSKVHVKSIDEADLTQKVGTGVLLQHIAPHLTGAKSKRRASCGGRLEVNAANDMAQVSDSPSTSQGKKLKKRKSMWDEPLQEGEYEIVIPREEIMARKKRLSDANVSLSTPKRSMRNPFASPAPSSKPNTPGSSSKKVNFALQRNRAQCESEYYRTLRENPDVPYDANKEPPRGVLKPSPYSSPVNPFYKHNFHM